MINKYEIVLDYGFMKIEIRGASSLDEVVEFLNAIEPERRVMYHTYQWRFLVRDLSSTDKFVFTFEDDDLHLHAVEVER